MSKHFAVKGVNPLGRIVEVVILADTAADAKAQAEDVGLKYVMVTERETGWGETQGAHRDDQSKSD